METVSIVVAIIIIVFGILQIVLFFKLWGMANDIRTMKDKYMSDMHKITIEDNIEIDEETSKHDNNPIISNVDYNLSSSSMRPMS